MARLRSSIVGHKKSVLAADAQSDSAFIDEMVFVNFWRYRRKWLVGFALGVFALVAVYQGLQMWSAFKLGYVQSAFLKAWENDADLLAFAHKNPGTPLGGVAYLAVADAAYRESDFTSAAQAYESAAFALEGTPFAARARLGQGVALLRNGEDVGSLLDDVAADEAGLTVLRAQAVYLSAVQGLNVGSLAAYDQGGGLLESLPFRIDFWINKLRFLGSAFPELKGS